MKAALPAPPESFDDSESCDEFLRAAGRLSEVPPASCRATRLIPGQQLVGGRLRVVRVLGEGGMGIVYEVWDRERKGTVALKTLAHMDAARVYILKNELRSLADVDHPHLVRLHELFEDSGRWMFTMDLVDGVTFDRWVRPEGTLDPVRLRAALAELVSAVTALHYLGKLHRDLKPSNALVDQGGHVRVLDFGLVRDPDTASAGETLQEEHLTGTPAYMAPEQAAGQPATEASDWYAVGSMLFEALSGKLPFAGASSRILARKQSEDPPRAFASSRGVDDLRRLCNGMLRRAPERRASGTSLQATVLAASSPNEHCTVGQPPPPAHPPPSRPSGSRVRFVRPTGRDAELAQLKAAYEHTRTGHLSLAFIAGESGIGKSTLAASLLNDLRATAGALVLTGRCNERESIPFKAFDTVVDGLSRHLRRLGAEALALLPRETYALTRLFPVLQRVDVIDRAPQRQVFDPREVRQRGFQALYEILVRISDRQPLVIHLDDLQWLDEDSTVLLQFVLTQSTSLPALFVLSHREASTSGSSPLARLERVARDNPLIRSLCLQLGPLSPVAATALASTHLGQSSNPELAERVAREAGGNPFFIHEVACFVQESGGAGTHRVSFDDMLLNRVSRLPPGELRLVQIAALAGQPLPREVLAQAAGIPVERASFEALDKQQLLSGTGPGSVQCSHDRVRESVAASTPSHERTSLAGDLARTLEQSTDSDPELLMRCHRDAGSLRAASRWAIHAAERAAESHAFEHAARLYETALESSTPSRKARCELLCRQGELLALAGLGSRSAEAYQAAAQLTQGARVLDLQRLAAEQLLIVGHFDEGRSLMERALRVVRIRLPSNPLRAILSLLVHRAWLWMRGLNYEARQLDELEAPTRQRLELLSSAAKGFGFTDTPTTIALSGQFTRAALNSGELVSITSALGTDVLSRAAVSGPGGKARRNQLLRVAEAAAEQSGVPMSISWVHYIRGACDFHEGRWAQCREQVEHSLEILREAGIAPEWQVQAAHLYQTNARIWGGDFRDLAATGLQLTTDARRRGDDWAVRLFAAATAAGHLASDDQLSAARCMDLCDPARRPRAFLLSDWMVLTARSWLRIYQEDTIGLVDELVELLPALRRGQLLQIAGVRVATCGLVGGLALRELRALEAAPARQRHLQKLIRHQARSARRAPFPTGPATHDSLLAGLSLFARDRQRAVMHLQRSLEPLVRLESGAWSEAARRRLGQVLGGADGRALVAQSDRAMAALGVSNPEAMTEMLLPGLRPTVRAADPSPPRAGAAAP